MIDWVLAVLFWVAVASPMMLTVGAFLDAARRPEWAWAMAQRRRVVWLSMFVAGGVTIIGGPIVAIAYLIIARRDIADAENGRFA